jgi:DNA topoisomerase-1
MRPATAADRKKYAIPPAYTNAMVATDPKAELRATAYSPATGKTASYYTKAYKARQAAAKWSRVMSVHRDMPTLWRKISTSKDQEAMTLRVILRTGLRNGNEGQGEEKAYGASNLRMEHVSVDGDTVRLQFPGKSGVAQDHSFTDSVVADYVRKREKAGAETLFDHTADDTLSYLRQISGGKKLKVHDLRTWHGTVLADALVTTAVREGLIPKTAKEFKAFRKQIGTHVAKALGNTPAVTLSTYIHPSVFRPLEVKK